MVLLSLSPDFLEILSDIFLIVSDSSGSMLLKCGFRKMYYERKRV